MTPKAKFDQNLSDFRTRGTERINGLTFTDPHALSARTLSLQMLERSEAVHSVAIEAASNANHAVYNANARARAAKAQAGVTYEALYNTLQATYYNLATNDPPAAAAFLGHQSRVGADTTPAMLRDLGLNRMINTIALVLVFADIHVPDNVQLASLRQAHDALKSARDAVDTQTGKESEAMAALKSARILARRFYSSARNFMAGAFDIEGRNQNITRFMPPLSAIYATHTHTNTDSTTPPATPPAHAPTAPETPAQA